MRKSYCHRNAGLKTLAVLAIACFSLFPVGCGLSPTRGDDAGDHPGNDLVYTVKKGDTPSNIARKITGHASDWQTIAERNDISDSSRMKVGQKIMIPARLVFSSKTGVSEEVGQSGLRQRPRKTPGYQLGPGDRVRITVFGHKALSGAFDIDGRGLVSLPLIQNVKASGLTASQLEDTIAAKLHPDYLKHPQVSVGVLSYRPFYILGEVIKPGSYPYVNGMTVINAVALAGGYTYRADQEDVTILRANDPEKKERPINASGEIFPGDVIHVPERWF
jgi:LysM repeat protein